jgi:cyclophilin family peptidyl-prolyl cis-trans isomerase
MTRTLPAATRIRFGVLLLLLGLCTRALLAGTGVQFRTPLGDIEVELLDAEKPQTVRNFLQHVEAGLYQDSFIHYLVPGFVASGGAYKEINRGLRTADFAPIVPLPAIPNEVRTGTVVSNLFGTLAMGRLVENGARPITGEWFFNLGTNSPALESVNGGYPVFGKVISGLSVLQTFNQFVSSAERTTNALIILFDPNLPFAAGPRPVIPVTTVDPSSIAGLYRNVLWVDVTLLQVHISAAAAGGHEIRWAAVPGRTNRVEYTEGFPPSWKTLAASVASSTNGLALDPAVANRFYRVQVDPPPGR